MKRSENLVDDRSSSSTLYRDWEKGDGNLSTRSTESLALYKNYADPAATISRPVDAPHSSTRVKKQTINLKRKALVMITGVVVGVVSTLFFLTSKEAPSMEVAQTAAPALHVSVGSAAPLPQSYVETETLIPVALNDPPHVASSDGVIEYITQHTTPVLAEREYLFISNSERISDLPQNVANSPDMPHIYLQALENTDGRYQAGNSTIEWQGSWQLNNPAANLETGSAYRDYLSSFSGSSHFGSLMTFESNNKSSLLQQLNSSGDSSPAPARHP